LLLIKYHLPDSSVRWYDWRKAVQSFYNKNETESIILNPLLQFNQTGIYQLDLKSPCIKAGTWVGLTSDFLGNKWRNPPSMGAIEYYNIRGTVNPRARRIEKYDAKSLVSGTEIE
jgi:hypothetical protein